jgi:glycosyltransferase involved in cell wall biosynthesis
MRVSIVTTTFNALPYLPETVRSILQAPLAELEYLVVDAGSRDGTLEYLRGVRDERMRVEVLEGAGQYEAIDWGLRQTTGEVMAWLNADDTYFPWTIDAIVQLFSQYPDVHWITGLPTVLNREGVCTLVSLPSSYPRKYIRNGWFHELAYGNLVQESMFWRRDLYTRAGGLDLKYRLAADFELWTRFARYAPLDAVTVPLAAWRKHGDNRSLLCAPAYIAEVAQAAAALPRLSPWKRWLCRTQATRHALRLAEWHRTARISYSLTKSAWRREMALRPISRYDLQHLKMEFLAARAAQQENHPLGTAHSA